MTAWLKLLFAFFLWTPQAFSLSMPAPGQAACPMNYSPVCGADGQTYSNPCLAQNSGVTYRSGACQNNGLTPEHCIHCGGNPHRGITPLPGWQQQFPAPFFAQRPMPWWGYYGQQRYPNFHYPGAWSGGGINPHAYPGNGAAFAAKPNVYLEGREGQEFRLDLAFGEHASHLVSSPELNQAWEVEFHSKRKLKHQQSFYEYLFYDFRFDEELAQYERGFCTDAENLIPEMLALLTQSQFTRDELDDFQEHWGLKIPFSNHYCVYPQFNEELEKIVPLKAFVKEGQRWVPTPTTRVLFVIHLHDQVPESKPRPARVDQPENSPLVREWGVAFIAAP